MNRYRSGDLPRRWLYLAELIGAAVAGAGVWFFVVLIFSLVAL